jgi:dipeptidyl aminopeptidase/acylaminoacyl peptidase
MADLRERFRGLDRLETPDLWPEVERLGPRSPLDLRFTPGRRLGAALVALAVATAGTVFAIRAFRSDPRGPAAAPADNVVFTRERDGRWDLFSLDPGGATKQVTATVFREFDPAWSPDGTLLAFAAGPDERDAPTTSIAVLDAATGARTELVSRASYSGGDEPNPVGQPSWSPSAEELAFTVYGDGGGIYVRRPSGAAERLTFAGPPTGRVDAFPSWSPDGSSIVYLQWDLGSNGYSVMEVDPATRETSLLTELPDVRSDPTGFGWSPDGSRLVFSAGDVFTMAADGSQIVRLTDTPNLIELEPAWSPDGARIAFAAEVGDRSADIYVMNADGSGVVRLTVDPGIESHPSWGPAWTAPPVAKVEARVTHTIEVGPFPNAVAVGEGAVWVSAPRNDGSGGGDVVRIDPETGEIVARIPVDELPGWEVGGGGLAVGAGSVWISGTRSGPDGPDPDSFGEGRVVLTRIDPTSNDVADVLDLGPGNSADVWVDDTGIWVLLFTPKGNELEVLHADLLSHRVLERFRVPGEWSQVIFAAGGSVWVSALVTGTDGAFGGRGSQAYLDRIDPSTYAVERTACSDCNWLFPQPAGSWLKVEGGVQRFDPLTGQLAGEPVKLSEDCCGGPFVSDGEGGVWVSDLRVDSEGRTLWHVNSVGLVDAGIDIESGAEAESMGGVAYGFDPVTQTIWIVHYRDSVARIEIKRA